MIKGIFVYGNERLDDVLLIRSQCIKKDFEYVSKDNIDNDSIHCLVFQKDKVVATGRIFINNNIAEISKICVLLEYANKGFEDFLVRLLMDKVFGMGFDYVYIEENEVNIDNINIYKKIGFNIIDKKSNLLKKSMIRLEINKKSMRKCCNSNL